MFSDVSSVAVVLSLFLSVTLAVPLPPQLPADWVHAYEQADLMFATEAEAVNQPFPSLSNGFIGAVSTCVDCHPNPLFAAGVYNGAVLSNESVVKADIPHFQTAVPSNSSTIVYGMNMRESTLHARFRLLHQAYVEVHELHYAHQTRPSLMVKQYNFTNSGEQDVNVTITNTNADLGTQAWVLTSINATADWYGVQGHIVTPQTPQSPQVSMTLLTNRPPEQLLVPKQSTVTFCTLNVLVHSLNSSNTLQDALLFMKAAVADCSTGALWQEHTAAWADRWDKGRIEVAGDLPLAQVVNASLYSVMTAYRSDWPFGTSPGGLPSTAYEGHIFWDQTLWMAPPLVLLAPGSAEACLEYRYARMEAARDKAQQNGYAGTMYPWESAFTGMEAQRSGGTVGPWGTYEQHITGDVALLAQMFYSSNHDDVWLKTRGWPLLSGIAEFWASRVEFNKTYNKYVINGVMGPDEYHYPVDNNAYTNAIAALSLGWAVSAAKVLGQPVPSKWTTIAGNMYIPTDSVNKYHPEYDGYVRGATVKQADTILLSYPLGGLNMPAEYLTNDLVYYANVTDPNGPSMTWSMFAIGWLNLKEWDKASVMLKKAYQTVKAPFNVWDECVAGCTQNFVTGAGGFNHLSLFGYGGLRLNAGYISVDPPPLPGTVTSWTTRLSYLGVLLQLRHDNSTLCVECVEDSGETDLVLVDSKGSSHSICSNDGPVTVPVPQTVRIQANSVA